MTSPPLQVTDTGRVSMPSSAARIASDEIKAVWSQLITPSSAPFDTAALARIPEPGRRWLTRSIGQQAPAAVSALVEMRGQIKTGAWLPFHAWEVINVPLGFVWIAKAQIGPLSLTGHDQYANGRGQMLWRLQSLIPVIRAQGPDTDRSAAGRLLAESFFVPTALMQDCAAWLDSPEPSVARVSWRVGSQAIPVDYLLSDTGSLREVRLMRWGAPSHEVVGEYPYRVVLGDEAEFHGVRIPTSIRAGWYFEPEAWAKEEYFRAELTSVTLL